MIRTVAVSHDDFEQTLKTDGGVWMVTGTDEETHARVTFTSDSIAEVVDYVMDTGETWLATVEDEQIVQSLFDELGVEEILEANDQEQRHEAAPEVEPKYLPADEPGFETEAYTAGGPEEEDA